MPTERQVPSTCFWGCTRSDDNRRLPGHPVARNVEQPLEQGDGVAGHRGLCSAVVNLMPQLNGQHGTYPANEGIWIDRIIHQLGADLK
jgi:hypothetical protein